MSAKERMPIDTVGYATTRAQMDRTIQAIGEYRDKYFYDLFEISEKPLLCAICPHDDYLYAGSLYEPVMERLDAETIIMIGVLHNTSNAREKEAVILDDYESWKGPLGPIKVNTSFRDYLKENLNKEDYLVCSTCHGEEHSLEGFLPFLQHYNNKATIVPILIPPMPWERIGQLAVHCADCITGYMGNNALTFGNDIQILISNDSTHYGDQNWGGSNYNPFGSDIPGLIKAKKQDLDLINNYLVGELSPNKIRKLLYSLTNESNLLNYLITWCGRFSIPFGLELTRNLARMSGMPIPNGHMFAYDTSVELGELPLKEVGLGSTAPANMHHWVAYLSMGFF